MGSNIPYSSTLEMKGKLPTDDTESSFNFILIIAGFSIFKSAGLISYKCPNKDVESFNSAIFSDNLIFMEISALRAF